MAPGYPALHAILDVDAAERAGWDPSRLAAAFLDGGARFIQVRAKQLAAERFLDLCEDVVHQAQSYDATVIVNDRADLARMSGARGVHVGQDDLPPAAARQVVGGDAIVGYSTHSIAQIDAAMALPVSYIAVGPIFGTKSKETGYDAVGLELVRDAAARAGKPIVAIGGITLETAASVIAAGAAAVAVIGDLLVTGDPRRRVEEYVRRLG